MNRTVVDTKCVHGFVHGFLHDWRHLEQHARYENVDTDQEEVVTVDYWYCTRCRVIDSSERERIPTKE